MKKQKEENFSSMTKQQLISKLKETTKEKEKLNKQLNTANKKLNETSAKLKDAKQQINLISKEKEILTKQIRNEKVNIINKDVYQLYDSIQKTDEDDIEMTDSTDENQYEKNFNEFLKYLNEINTEPNTSNNLNNSSDEDDDDDSYNDPTIFLTKNEINKIINHNFGDNLSDTEFLKAFKIAIINNVNNNWKLIHRKLFKESILKLSESKIKEIFYHKVPLHIRQLKLDILLNATLSKIYKIEEMNLNYIIIELENYSTIPLQNGIKFYDPIGKKDILFDKNYIIKKILNNVGILNAYYKVIQKFVTNKFDKKKLAHKIKEIVNNTNIYFCDLPKKYLGITICNGDIFISGKFLQESLHKSKNNYYNFTAVTKIYLTLLHEFAHKIQYILRRDFGNKDETNYFIKTFHFINDNFLNFDLIENIQLEKDEKNNDYFMCQKMKLLPKNDLGILKSYIYLHNIPTPCESGDFFDSEIYLGQTQSIVNKKICEFFILSSCKNYDEYVSVINEILSHDKERSTNAAYKEYEYGKKAVCYHSYVRNNYNN